MHTLHRPTETLITDALSGVLWSVRYNGVMNDNHPRVDLI